MTPGYLDCYTIVFNIENSWVLYSGVTNDHGTSFPSGIFYFEQEQILLKMHPTHSVIPLRLENRGSKKPGL